MDIKGHILVNNEDKSKGKFAFTTEDYEVYEICVISKVPPSMFLLLSGYLLACWLTELAFTDLRGQKHEVELTVKMGLEAKNYETVSTWISHDLIMTLW